MQVAVALSRRHIVDETLFRLEIEAHLLALVGVATLGVDGLSLKHPGGVRNALCVDKAAVHVDRNLGRVELHVLIVDLAAAIEPGQASVRVIDHRVLRRVGDGVGDAGALSTRTVGCKTVSQQGIGSQRVGRKQRQGEAVAGCSDSFF